MVDDGIGKVARQDDGIYALLKCCIEHHKTVETRSSSRLDQIFQVWEIKYFYFYYCYKYYNIFLLI